MTGESIILFQRENKFKVYKIFITSENNSVFLIIIFIIFRSFSRKQNKCLKLCYFSVFWFSIVSLKFQINNGFHFNFSLLQKCPKNDFFNLETLTFCRHIQHITLHKIFFFFLAVTNIKYKNYTNFYKFLLLLSGDVSLNPGPVQRSPDISSTIWEPISKKGLHFLHININSLLLKKEEIRCIANKTKAAIIGLTESKLDHTIPDSEVNFPGYDILRCDRNRNGGGVACYIRKDLCFNTRTLHCKEIENLVFDILLPKSKAITTGVFYRPPNQAEFMYLMVEKLSNLNLKDNEIYLLGDFNTNLFQNGKYILNGERRTTSQGSVHIMINKYR